MELSHEEIQVIWEALNQYIDNAATDDVTGEAVGMEVAERAHNKLSEFLVPLLERGRRAHATLQAVTSPRPFLDADAVSTEAERGERP